MFSPASFGWYFPLPLMVISKGDEQFRKMQFCCISETARYLVNMFICPLFMIMPRAPTITDAVQHFFTFYFQVLFYYILWLICNYLFGWYTNLKICFSFIILNHYIWSIAFYFSICSDCKVPKNGCCFCYWFWLVFISFFHNSIICGIHIISKEYNDRF